MCEPYTFTQINVTVFFVCPLDDDDRGKAKATPTPKPKLKGGISENSIIALAVSGVVAIAIVCVTVFVVLYKHSAKLPASEMAMENLACKASETI